MDIYLTRHSKRRAKLYKISIEDILAIINKYDLSSYPLDSVINIIDSEYIEKYKYPIKIVLKKELLKLIIFTVFPYKGKKDESSLRQGN